MGINIGGKIEKVNGKNLCYRDFEEKYLGKNQPVVLTGLMDDWRACKDWVTHDGKPNLHFFSTHFGKSKVQVADCGTREFTDQKREQMSVSEFINQWLENSSQENDDAANVRPVLYLKDWHFVKEYPEYLAYRTPLFFCDDWLNLYLDNYRMHKDHDTYQDNNEICCSDYRFVYMGAKESWTPLHADVFRSYSWSSNICGKKKWLFLSPSQHHLVFDRNMRNSVYNIFEDVSETEFPGFKKAVWLECIQEPNEIIFVPSGWFHQVLNLEDTISINHNWINAYNLSWVWDLLVRDYNEAKDYIEDIKDICDDFEGLCQCNLAANTGMNFYDFLIFISRFSLVNMVQLSYLLRDYEKSNQRPGPIARHLALNLVSLRKIALKMRTVGVLEGNRTPVVDLRETLDDPAFHKLCTELCRTYGIVHKHHEWSCEMIKCFMVDFEHHDYSISVPEDLVKFLNYATPKLKDCSFEENILLSKFDDAFLLWNS